jgi:Pyruvate/2-oxoacid:ferredoxin oxidoreductase gamma subunit
MALERLPLTAAEVLEVIRSRTNPKFLESNLKAFALGEAAAREGGNWVRR